MRTIGYVRNAMLALAGAGLTALASAPTAAPAWAQAATATISIKDHAFAPATLTVAPGTKVTWTNADDDIHNIVEADKLFRSPALDTNDTFSYTFATPGEFGYFCALHPYMVGKIVVKAGS